MVSAKIKSNLRYAWIALKQGKKTQARRLAFDILNTDPTVEEAWLILSYLAGPQARLYYLRKALALNPSNTTTRQRIAQAEYIIRKRQNLSSSQVTHLEPLSKTKPIKPLKTQRNKDTFFTLIKIFAFSGFLFLFFSIIFTVWLSLPAYRDVFASFPHAERPVGYLQKPTLTASITPTPTQTPTSTPTVTFTPTSTATNTFTPSPTETDVPTNTNTPEEPTPIPDNDLPEIAVEQDQRWIDVDLSDQTLTAYQGNEIIQTFVVSTGTWLTPTVTGTFRIYAMYESADMAGPGYYLPAVPYVLYFYKDYGIHGTYWHDNFGTPMSHGCINMRTNEAGWIFNWATIGTVVNIHE